MIREAHLRERFGDEGLWNKERKGDPCALFWALQALRRAKEEELVPDARGNRTPRRAKEEELVPAQKGKRRRTCA